MDIVYQGDCGFQSTHEEANKIYDHLRESLRTDSPERVIQRFRYLFLKGTGYDIHSVKSALDTIINTHYVEREFPFFLNRCCHIIINYWQKYPELKPYITQLLSQLDIVLPPGSANSKSARKLRKLIEDFQYTEQYIKLKRLGNLINQSQDNEENSGLFVGNLIQRYPFLYQHCLLSEDSSYEFKKTIKKIQKGIQKSYELDISQYITYRVRLAEIVRKYKASNKNKVPKKLIKPVNNPTLLSDRKLSYALKKYLGKAESGYTYPELAHNFSSQINELKYYQQFKTELYEYLVSGIDSQYGKQKFNQKLYQYLQNILPDFHAQPVDEFTIMRTCSSLLKFLVVDSIKNPNYDLFVELTANFGETKVIGLLLKLLLICHKVKPYLEQRFAILFSHYESYDRTEVPWLIDSLENLQLALSIHFGKADLSLVKLL